MKFVAWVVVICVTGTSADARETIRVHTGLVEFKVEVFAKRQDKGRPAVIILSGSKGFGSSAYDEIGNTFMAAGLDVYLAHLLSPDDINRIASAKDARSRIKYYNERRRHWMGALGSFVSMLRSQGYSGKTSLLGISLGAETAAIAVSKGLEVDAVVLVDGSPPRDQEFSMPKPLPFHLIWGSADKVYPVSSGERFMEQVKNTGATATMSVFHGGEHDFFLKHGTTLARDAYQSAIQFMRSKLNNK